MPLQIMLISHAEMRGAMAIPSTPPARPSRQAFDQQLLHDSHALGP